MTGMRKSARSRKACAVGNLQHSVFQGAAMGPCHCHTVMVRSTAALLQSPGSPGERELLGQGVSHALGRACSQKLWALLLLFPELGLVTRAGTSGDTRALCALRPAATIPSLPLERLRGGAPTCQCPAQGHSSAGLWQCPWSAAALLDWQGQPRFHE